MSPAQIPASSLHSEGELPVSTEPQGVDTSSGTVNASEALGKLTAPKPAKLTRDRPLLSGPSGLLDAFPPGLEKKFIRRLARISPADSDRMIRIFPQSIGAFRRQKDRPDLSSVKCFKVSGLSTFLYPDLTEHLPVTHQKVFAVYDRKNSRVFIDRAALEATIRESPKRRPRMLAKEIEAVMSPATEPPPSFGLLDGIRAGRRASAFSFALCMGPLTDSLERTRLPYERGVLSRGTSVVGNPVTGSGFRVSGGDDELNKLVRNRAARLLSWYTSLTGAEPLRTIRFEPVTPRLFSYEWKKNSLTVPDRMLDLNPKEFNALLQFSSIYMATRDRTIAPLPEQRELATLVSVCVHMLRNENIPEFRELWNFAQSGLNSLSGDRKIQSPIGQALDCVVELLQLPESEQLATALRKKSALSQEEGIVQLETLIRKLIMQPRNSDRHLFRDGRDSDLPVAPTLQDISARKLRQPLVSVEEIAKALWETPQEVIQMRASSRHGYQNIVNAVVGIIVPVWEAEYLRLNFLPTENIGKKLCDCLIQAAGCESLFEKSDGTLTKNPRHLFAGVLQKELGKLWTANKGDFQTFFNESMYPYSLTPPLEDGAAESVEPAKPHKRKKRLSDPPLESERELATVIRFLNLNPDQLFKRATNPLPRLIGIISLVALSRFDDAFEGKKVVTPEVSEMIRKVRVARDTMFASLLKLTDFSIGTMLRENPKSQALVEELCALPAVRIELLRNFPGVLKHKSRSDTILGTRQVPEREFLPADFSHLSSDERDHVEGVVRLMQAGLVPVSGRVISYAAAVIANCHRNITQTPLLSREPLYSTERALFELLCLAAPEKSSQSSEVGQAFARFFELQTAHYSKRSESESILSYFMHYTGVAGANFSARLLPTWAVLMKLTADEPKYAQYLKKKIAMLHDATPAYRREIATLLTDEGERLVPLLRNHPSLDFKRFILTNTPRGVLHNKLADLSTEELRDTLRGIPLDEAVALTAGVLSKTDRREFSHRESYEVFRARFPMTVTDLRFDEEVKNYCAALGVPRNASLDVIRASYRKLSIIYHSDLFQLEGPEAVAYAKEQFQTIQAAYEVLSDPERKRAHLTRLPNRHELYPDRPWYIGLPEISDVPAQILGIEYGQPPGGGAGK